MKISVEYLGHIKNLTGNKRQEELTIKENATVSDLLTELAEKCGDAFKKAVYEPSATDVKANFIVTVNGYLLNQLNGVDTILKEGDHVILLPVVSGG